MIWIDDNNGYETSVLKTSELDKVEASFRSYQHRNCRRHQISREAEAVHSPSSLLPIHKFSSYDMESSRIFIRGLPPQMTADAFQRHFSKQSSITDARLLPHRRIGYVGYKTPEDALKAVKYHNRSFINMSRIQVELARSVRLPLKSSSAYH